MPGLRETIATGCVFASSASGAYHWRTWYMLTGPSAKYTAISTDPGAGFGADGSRCASCRRLRRDVRSRSTSRRAVRRSLMIDMVVLRVCSGGTGRAGQTTGGRPAMVMRATVSQPIGRTGPQSVVHPSRMPPNQVASRRG